MGNVPEKELSAKNIGDQTVTIVENQEVHTVAHSEHALKLNLILVILSIQALVATVKFIIRIAKRQLVTAATKAVIQNV